MIRRRTALPATAVASTLLAAPLLAACGSAPHPGAAAVVDGKRITVSQLQAQVRDVTKAQSGSPNAQQLLSSSGRLSRNTLIRMIQFRVIERAGRKNGISLSRRDVQQARKAGEQQAGGPSRLSAMYLEQGIAPSQVDTAVRMDLTRNTLMQKLGTAGVNEVFAKTSKELHIDVNPRYGRWDDTQGTSVLTQEKWLHPAQAPAQPGVQPAQAPAQPG
jgi:hypothetical protein